MARSLEIHNCGNCKFWSDLIAKSQGSQVVAMCLAVGSPYRNTYTPEHRECRVWRGGAPVDDPDRKVAT
jgi:hypothetical protein